MADLSRRVEEAREHVRPVWTGERERAVADAVRAQSRRRDRARTVGWISAALVVLSVIVFQLVRRPVGAAPQMAANPAVPSTPGAPPALRLADGSIAAPLRSSMALTVERDDADFSIVQLGDGGEARFEVVPHRPRVFRVIAGEVTVTVLGTVFSVERRGAAAFVAVREGRVRIDWSDGTAELGPGEEGLFPRTDVAPSTSAAPVVPAPVRSVTKPLDPGEILRSADEARLAGDPSRAVALYRKMLSAHPRDPRAPLASFSLGRVLLDQLGRPREAAAAFGAARSGDLAEDALAREIEAWSRAGETERARALSAEYLRLYPGGRRESAVKRYGGE
jgi:transmembrane sensor